MIEMEKNKKKRTLSPITYEEFSKENISLKKYKLKDLKVAAKNFKLHITGTKPVMIGRIEGYFRSIRASILIQSVFRRWMVMHSFRIRGPAFKNRSLCVNDTDFVTMEPLAEIPWENFFSYTDDKEFTYGFNVDCLVQMMKKTAFCNPYNREKFPRKIQYDILALYHISSMVFSGFQTEITGELYHRDKISYTPSSSSRQNSLRPAIMQSLPIARPLMEDSQRHSIYNLENEYSPNMQNPNFLLENPAMEERYRMIRQLRERTVTQRIEELFMQIDQLGNYTQSRWFSQLDIRGYTRLYRCLFDIWNYRSQMTLETRSQICPFYNPFEGIFNRSFQNIIVDQYNMKIACLIVMENMIYSGIDEDHRKLGAFHALSALTIVSSGARTAMPWLYESVV